MMSATERSRSYPSQSQASPYLKGSNQGYRGQQRQALGQEQGLGQGSAQENQRSGFGRLNSLRQAANADVVTSLRSTNQGYIVAPSSRTDDISDGRDYFQQERDNNDLQYGR